MRGESQRRLRESSHLDAGLILVEEHKELKEWVMKNFKLKGNSKSFSAMTDQRHNHQLYFVWLITNVTKIYPLVAHICFSMHIPGAALHGSCGSLNPWRNIKGGV